MGVLLLAGLLAAPAQAQDRYALAGGCYVLSAGGAPVTKTADGGYRTGGQGERFRLQATALGSYLLYGAGRDFLGHGRGPLPVSPERVQSAAAPSEATDWRVEVVDGAYVLSLGDRPLAVQGGRLVLGGTAARFAFEPATGCADYPEAETNVSGEPAKGATPFGEVSGLLDAHMHMMAFEFLGGRVHCGRPWHPFGVASALVDCPDHEPAGVGAIGENVLSYGNPVGMHDTRGWPTLKDWPHHASLTHEQTYYRWLERSYRGGLRLMVNLLVDNEVLCTLYPYKRNSCNEMDGVRLQARRLRELQDYIDAQHGGPGKGWLRIVTDPFEARRQINAGKLAVVMGIEVSKLFDCGVQDGRPECTAEQIDQRLKEVYDLGVRDMELVNKFDNALGGVAGDSGTTGVVVNVGNRIETGRFWQMGPCEDAHNHDRAQPTAPGVPDRDQLAGNILNALLPPGAAPLYGQPPHCNALGLSPLGEHLVNRMMDRGMVIDPDHLSVRARQQLLDVVERRGYSGVVSSHSWSTPDAIPRILRLGGVVTPMAGSTTDFAAAWRDTRAAPRPALLLGHRLGRRHERLRLAGRAARGRERQLSVPLVRRPHGRPPAQRPARVRHQRGRHGPLRALPRLGRGPAAARRAGGRRRPRPRRGGVPADVGARRRRAADPLRAARGRAPPGAGWAACGCGRARPRCCGAPGSLASVPGGPGGGAASRPGSTRRGASSPCGARRAGTVRWARDPAGG